MKIMENADNRTQDMQKEVKKIKVRNNVTPASAESASHTSSEKYNQKMSLKRNLSRLIGLKKS